MAAPAVDLHREIQAIAAEYGIAMAMPAAATQHARQLTYPDTAATLAGGGRRDLRALPLVTIDGADSKDFDDAVHCRRLAGGGFELHVVIADVSLFVRPGDPLDTAAAERGTSAYFPGTVFPMLPLRLSADWCSLLPGAERMGLACRLELDAGGAPRGGGFFECVMRSHRRLTYEEADRIIGAGEPGEVGASLAALGELTRLLLGNRLARGGLDLDLARLEPAVAGGRVKGFYFDRRLFAHRVIEESMLAANVAAADFLAAAGQPFLYRIHGKPEPLKARRLQRIMDGFGIRIGNVSDPRDMQRVIDAIGTQPPLVARALLMNILRTLQRAIYTPADDSHYGLGYGRYTHFTSPIRRYPDLLVHRAIKAALRRERPPDGLADRLVEIGAACSEREMAADRAGLDLTQRLHGKMQAGRVGEEMEAVVVGMSPRGMFMLAADGLDGMVRFSSLEDDFYEVDQDRTAAVGQRRRRVLRIGQPHRVRLAHVGPDDGRVRLELVE